LKELVVEEEHLSLETFSCANPFTLEVIEDLSFKDPYPHSSKPSKRSMKIVAPLLDPKRCKGDIQIEVFSSADQLPSS